QKLHASLALLPVDATQADYLFDRLKGASPSELPVLLDFLQTHRSRLTPKLWTVLESAKAGDASVLPAGSALASYAPDDKRWEAQRGKLALGLVSVNAAFLGPWMEALRPVRGKLTSPLAAIFGDKTQRESVHAMATDILTDYASDDPDVLADLLMVSEHAAPRLFTVAEKNAEQVSPVLLAELDRKAKYSWNDPTLDPTSKRPEAAL